MKSCGNKVTV